MTRQISAEVEVPGTPEEVWDAIGTAAGISAWFVPAEIDGDRMTQHHGRDLDSTSQITASERPRRFAYADDYQPSPDAEPRRIATEFLVEARQGGACVVRVVQSGFGSGDAWERAIDSFSSGWPAALDDLRLYLTHFAGQPAGSFAIGAPLALPRERAWPTLSRLVGLPEAAAPGDRLSTHGAPPFGGTIERVDEGFLSFRLEQPLPGIGFIGAGGPTDEPYAFVRGRLFGEHAREVAAHAEAAWREWLDAAEVS